MFQLSGDRDLDWGMKSRIARFLRPSTGRTVMVACDHGYFMGPTHGLEDPRSTLLPLAPLADAIAVTRGVVRTSVDPAWNVPVVLRVSGGASILRDDLSDEGLMTSMRDAIRLNAAAVAMSVFIGTPHEKQTLLNLGSLVDHGEEFGMPVMAITAVGKELEKRDARYLSLACRISAEFGAHLVKTYYCDGFSKVVDSCPVPLVVAGGPKLGSEDDVFNLVYGAIAEGAAGVDMGRNIWQNPSPVGMLKAIRAIVHDQATVAEARGIYKASRDLVRGKAENTRLSRTA